jgi:hypothetical protein
MTCIGVPISWPRLEAFALDPADAGVRDHVAACTACRQCLDEIRSDVVALPRLPVIAAKPRRRWLAWAVPAFALAAAAAIAVLVLRPRPEPEPRADRVAIKGVGEVLVDVVRERAGVITDSARTFRPGDRWKVVVTCPPEAGAAIALEVYEVGGAPAPDRPVPTAQLACGNRVVVPGAFELTGARANRVCVRVNGEAELACVTVSPER